MLNLKTIFVNPDFNPGKSEFERPAAASESLVNQRKIKLLMFILNLLFSLVVKYLFRVQVAPVRFREEPNLFFLRVFLFF